MKELTSKENPAGTVRVELLEYQEGKSSHRVLVRRRLTSAAPWRLYNVRLFPDPAKAVAHYNNLVFGEDAS